ncbi:MAG: DUF692 family multinuclear iron-containing protein [Anaerolineae bacterium]
MKIGATLSPALLSLLASNAAEVDYIEVNGEQSAEILEQALALRPVLLHDISEQFWLNYEEPFAPATMDKARAMIDRARPPWHSTGIGASAEPQGHTTDYWRGAPASALQSRERCLANIVRNGKRLSAWLGMPLLLENYNYHPTNAYEYVCDPDTFTRLVDEIGCLVLLDLAHAQISAFNMGWSSAQEYLQSLPLHKVREIHLNHPYNDGGRQMLDRHLPIGEPDAELLRWTLARTPQAEAITLESESPSEVALLNEIRLARQVIE